MRMAGWGVRHQIILPEARNFFHFPNYMKRRQGRGPIRATQERFRTGACTIPPVMVKNPAPAPIPSRSFP